MYNFESVEASTKPATKLDSHYRLDKRIKAVPEIKHPSQQPSSTRSLKSRVLPSVISFHF